MSTVSNMDDSGESTENNMTSFGFDHCPFQLRRIGAAATCKGIDDVFLLNKPKLTIGRHIAMVDMYLNSSVHKQLISRQHAILTIEHHNNKHQVYIQDKSTNGTFVNDVKIAGKVGIKDGDTLTFGHTSGVKLKPGMLSRQIYSEFRFVFEKVLSENAPPTAELKVPSIFISRLATNPISRDHDLSPLGHDAAVLSDIAVVQKSNSENKIPRCSTPSRISSPQPNSKLESSDTLTPTNFGTPQRFTPRNDQTPASKSKPSTDFHLQSTPVPSEMPCIAEKNPSLNSSPEILAPKPFRTTLKISAIRQEKAPGNCISNKETRSPQSKDTNGSGICEEDKRTASNLDDELFQLTSAVSAKTELFDSSASEQEFDNLSQRFQFGRQNFLAPNVAKTSPQTRWTSSTPCQAAQISASSDDQIISRSSKIPASSDDQIISRSSKIPASSEDQIISRSSKISASSDDQIISRSSKIPASSDDQIISRSSKISASSDNQIISRSSKIPASSDDQIISRSSKISASSDDQIISRSSPLVSITISTQTPMRNPPSASDQEKITSCLGDSVSTEPSKKKRTMKVSEEVQSKKRGGQPSAEKAKKKCTKRHHRRTAKTKTLPSIKQPLGPPNEAQIPDAEVEVCDSHDCCRPTDSTLAWVQCDGCDSWYHVTCVGCDYDSIKKDSASFHCGCSK